MKQTIRWVSGRGGNVKINSYYEGSGPNPPELSAEFHAADNYSKTQKRWLQLASLMLTHGEMYFSSLGCRLAFEMYIIMSMTLQGFKGTSHLL